MRKSYPFEVDLRIYVWFKRLIENQFYQAYFG